MPVNDTDVVIFRWIMTSKIEPKSLSPDAFARLKICQNAFAARPGPAGGAHSAPQRPLVGFVGALRGGDGKWEGRKGKGREERRWRGEDGRGGEGPLRLRLPGSLFYPSPPLNKTMCPKE